MNHVLSCLIFVCLVPNFLYCQTFPKDWAVKWEHSSRYLTEIAESMPAEQYGFKPTEAQMSFSDQILHLSANMVLLPQRFLGSDPLVPPLPDTLHSKDEAIELMKRTFRYCARQVGSIAPESWSDTVPSFWAGAVPRTRILWLITDHMAHHRGQLITYLRLKGIQPPDYIGW